MLFSEFVKNKTENTERVIIFDTEEDEFKTSFHDFAKEFFVKDTKNYSTSES